MSFGFGLSLPAYPLRGGGGNNPFNQLGPTLDLSFAGTVTDLSDPNGYTLNTNFITPQYQIAAQYLVWELGVGLVDKTFSQIITFTRASTATYFDSAGVLQSAAIDVPRFDYNPATLAARGLLIEEQRTNGIRNNTMQGATAGAPGVFPTNWAASLSGSGVTQEIAAVGTENGIAYVDVRYFGTPSAGTNVAIGFEGPNQIAAASGQTWVASVFLKLQAGSFNNTSTILSLIGTDGVNGTESITSSVITSTPSNLRESRISLSGTFANALTTRAQSRIRIGYTVGVAFDITLRIGLPQLEQGAFVTSVIPTTTTALTRSADVASVNTLSPWYNASASTLYTEFNTPVPTTVTNSAVVVGYDDGTANNRFSNFYVSNTGAVSANQTTAGAANYTITGASGLTLSSVQKQATRFQAGSYASSVNGAAAVTDSFASAPPTVNTLRFGLRPSGTQANMWLRRVTVYPRGLSNAELQAITA